MNNGMNYPQPMITSLSQQTTMQPLHTSLPQLAKMELQHTKELLNYDEFKGRFRQEVRSHSRESYGIFKIHQFQRVDVFIGTLPHDKES